MAPLPTLLLSLLLGRASSAALQPPTSAAPGAGCKFVILRHGETNHNADGIIQGSSDVSVLTDKGKEQARRAGEQLAELYQEGSISKVFVSPLSRARDTLELCRKTAPLPTGEIVLADLREVDLWDWEGRNKADLRRERPDEYEAWKGQPLLFSVSGKKPIVDLWARARNVWREIHSQVPEDPSSGTILVVCHSGIGQALLSTALGEDERSFRRRALPNCGAVELEWIDGYVASTDGGVASMDSDCLANRWRWLIPNTSEWTLCEAQGLSSTERVTASLPSRRES
uniref:Phosphoglycerate mutase n=1 Tax=Chrysotila carterae TaxID=13221 RepID=A0A7S4C0X0_CHRCT